MKLLLLACIATVAVAAAFQAPRAPIAFIKDLDGWAWTDIMTSGKPLAYMFVQTDAERETWLKQLTSMAQKHASSLNIITSDVGETHAALAAELNLIPDIWPAFVIQDTTTRLKYPLKHQGRSLNASAIRLYVEQFLAGKVEPTIKSEPIPLSHDTAVRVVVQKNYDEIVLDDTKDVLLEFYNPACNPCKAFTHDYEALGDVFTRHSDKVTIAKVDETKNDVPDDIHFYPTIRLFPAGRKTSFVDYGGSRDIDDLAMFVREHGTYHVDVVNATLLRQVAMAEHDEL